MSKLEQVVESVSSVLGTEYSVQNIKVSKNNAVKTEGILIQNNRQKIGVTIYVPEDSFENATISEIADFVCHEYQIALTSKNPINRIEDFEDSQFVLSNVVYQLINEQKNANFLDSVPHKEFLDLALIYRVVLSAGDEGISSYVVSNDFLSKIEISIEELDKAAKENTIKRFAVSCLTLEEVVGVPFKGEKAIPQIYVLTNSIVTNGAVLMTYHSVLSDLAEKLDGNLIILPSSIHEVLVMAEDVDLSITDLRSMVESVNQKEVLAEEFLSNSVYRFVRDTGVIELV